MGIFSPCHPRPIATTIELYSGVPIHTKAGTIHLVICFWKPATIFEFSLSQKFQAFTTFCFFYFTVFLNFLYNPPFSLLYKFRPSTFYTWFRIHPATFSLIPLHFLCHITVKRISQNNSFSTYVFQWHPCPFETNSMLLLNFQLY